MKPRIVVFSISALAGTMREISRDYAQRASIELVSEAYEGALEFARKRYYTDTADVFIAAGSNGAFLENQLEAPLVLVKADGFDVMQALATARKSSEKIGLVSYESSFEELSSFNRAFDLDIPTRTYRTPQDARHAVKDLSRLGLKAIVGPGLVNEIAQEMGMEGILIYSRQGVMKAFEEAIRLASAKAAGATKATRSTYTYHTEQDILGSSQAVQLLRKTVRLCGSVDFSVLIQGETGVGKELVAQSIHSSSNGAGKPFVAINCAALTETLLESELFGFEEGSFSGAAKGGRAGMFESAQGGTVFLDEIGDMPLSFQTRLLRILEEGAVRRIGASHSRKVNFRLLAASHINLLEAVEKKQFRQDLYYRLNEMLIQIVPLRERPEDIAALAGYFLRTTPVRIPKSQIDQFLEIALPVLKKLDWPGNIRQLKNVCKRAAVLMTQESELQNWRDWFPDLFANALSTNRDSNPANEASLSDLTDPRLLDCAFRYHRTNKSNRAAIVCEALALANGEVNAVAKAFGISRSTVWRAKNAVTLLHSN